MADTVVFDDKLTELCDEYRRYNGFNSNDYLTYGVKRGLRNPDGTGVMAGLTNICNVHGFLMADGERIPDEGKLTYRGYDVNDIVNACVQENRFGYEETAWLLLFGSLPDEKHLKRFKEILGHYRELPHNFAEDMIMKLPSRDIMNKLAHSVLGLYTFDENPDDTSLENSMRQAIQLLACLPTIMTYAYQVKRRAFDKESMFFHPVDLSLSTSESILRALRADMKFTDSEAKLLDLCMILHAEHGGGNNSTFAARVLSSSGTDIYSAIAAAIGSLKGPRHGGANLRVRTMMQNNGISLPKAQSNGLVTEVSGQYNNKLYGAVWLLEKIAEEKNMTAEFDLYKLVEKLTPKVMREVKGSSKVICANVDFYSGFVYDMLGIPSDMFTPLFAVSRIAGWSAHRMEEVTYGGRIIRPAYRSMVRSKPYKPLAERVD